MLSMASSERQVGIGVGHIADACDGLGDVLSDNAVTASSVALADGLSADITMYTVSYVTGNNIVTVTALLKCHHASS